MRRRILLATLGVTGAALVIFGVPLGWLVGRVYRSEEFGRLQQAASIAAAAVPAGGFRGPDPVEAPIVDEGIGLAYYGTGGDLTAGTGPAKADGHVRVALGGSPSQGTAGARVVVAAPIITNETTVGAVEASAARSAVTSRTVRTWLIMTVLGFSALTVSALIALWQARRLAAPVDGLIEAADRLGEGDFTVRTPASGIAELDEAAAAIEAAAARLGELVNRERAFTAHASHQLRTPLTALRLDLENVLHTPGVDPRTGVGDAIDQVDRLAQTLEELLALARTGETAGPRVDLGQILTAFEQRWHAVLAAQGRRLHVFVADESIRHRSAPSSLAQMLDILVDNATLHGQGTVDVAVHSDVDWMSVDVTDEGGGISELPEPHVNGDRSQHDGHGLGLLLARSLAEGAGGALVLKRPGPRSVISVLLP
jgi:signal transduction histidine kinase